jgi:hypothetical protein
MTRRAKWTCVALGACLAPPVLWSLMLYGVPRVSVHITRR